MLTTATIPATCNWESGQLTAEKELVFQRVSCYNKKTEGSAIKKSIVIVLLVLLVISAFLARAACMGNMKYQQRRLAGVCDYVLVARVTGDRHTETVITPEIPDGFPCDVYEIQNLYALKGSLTDGNSIEVWQTEGVSLLCPSEKDAVYVFYLMSDSKDRLMVSFSERLPGAEDGDIEAILADPEHPAYAVLQKHIKACK